jgi:hypothetical protein
MSEFQKQLLDAIANSPVTGYGLITTPKKPKPLNVTGKRPFHKPVNYMFMKKEGNIEQEDYSSDGWEEISPGKFRYYPSKDHRE